MATEDAERTRTPPRGGPRPRTPLSWVDSNLVRPDSRGSAVKPSRAVSNTNEIGEKGITAANSTTKKSSRQSTKKTRRRKQPHERNTPFIFDDSMNNNLLREQPHQYSSEIGEAIIANNDRSAPIDSAVSSSASSVFRHAYNNNDLPSILTIGFGRPINESYEGSETWRDFKLGDEMMLVNDSDLSSEVEKATNDVEYGEVLDGALTNEPLNLLSNVDADDLTCRNASEGSFYSCKSDDNEALLMSSSVFRHPYTSDSYNVDLKLGRPVNESYDSAELRRGQERTINDSDLSDEVEKASSDINSSNLLVGALSNELFNRLHQYVGRHEDDNGSMSTSSEESLLSYRVDNDTTKLMKTKIRSMNNPVTNYHARDNTTYNSQRWEDRQCAVFTAWLNTVFHPEGVSNRVNNEQLLLEWNAATQLFDSPEMQAIRSSVEREVKYGRLAIAPRSDEGHLATVSGSDRNVLDEVHVREQLTELLLSYAPRWLQLGLGIVLGSNNSEVISTSHCMSRGSLNKVILERVLTDPSVVRKYTAGRCKTPSGKYESKMRIAIHRHALSQIMILVYFLDSAKRNLVITDDPCLFEKSSSIKSSEQVLISLCQDCFSMQKSAIKPLASKGISVSHVQHPIDEYDWHVKNLAVDLKDGVCLAKLIDTLTTNTSGLISLMRLPALTKQHNIHNVNYVLAALRQLGVRNISDITTAHIVAAHKPRILHLLWSIILYFQVPQFKPDIIEYKSSRLIQSHVRRFLGIRSYHLLRRGSVSIQAAYRGFVVRTKARKERSASISIQKIWRGYNTHVAYGFNLLAISTIQRFCRRLMSRKHNAVVDIQRTWRRYYYACWTDAAIIIQRFWRGYSARINYGFDMVDIVTVQSLYRRLIARKRTMRAINAIHSASIIIQKVWRGYHAKLSYGFDLMDIITAQSICRRFIVRKVIVRSNACAVKVQRVFRGWSCREQFGESQVLIPAIFRHSCIIKSIGQGIECLKLEHGRPVNESYDSAERFVARNSWSKVNDSDLSLEVEAASADVGSSELLAGALSYDLLNRLDHIVGSNDDTANDDPLDTASSNDKEGDEEIITTASSMFRRPYESIDDVSSCLDLKLGRPVNESYESTDAQSVCRDIECRVNDSDLSLKVETASTNAAHGPLLVDSMTDDLLSALLSPIEDKDKSEFRLQSAVKSSNGDADEVEFTTRHAYRKRDYVAEGKIAQQVANIADNDDDAHGLTSKRITSRNVDDAAVSAALIIQKVYRSGAARERFVFTIFAAVMIQSSFRRHLLQTHHRYLCKSTVLAQALYRGRRVRQELELQRSESSAATQIQRIWRGYRSNITFILLRLAAIKLQSLVRRKLSVIKYREMLETSREKASRDAAVAIQKIYRGFAARDHSFLTNFAATIIQSAFRRHLCVTKYRILRLSAILAQALYGGRRVRQETNAYLVQLEVERNRLHAVQRLETFAATQIQRLWRGYIANTDFMILLLSAIKIQSLVRGRKGKQQAGIRRLKAIMLQAAGRMFVAKLERSRIHIAMSDLRRSAAAIEIQRSWRGYRANVSFMFTVMSAMKIQSFIRFSLARSKAAELAKERCSAKARIERERILAEKRQWVAALATQFTAKSSSNFREVSTFPPSSIKINVTRHCFSPFISDMSAANEVVVPTNVLSDAIRTVQTSKKFHDLLNSILIMEKLTSRSIDACLLIVDEHVHEDLISMLCRCNRSIPHLELIRAILSVLTNLSQHSPLISRLASERTINTLTDLVHTFRDKSKLLLLSSSLLEKMLRGNQLLVLKYSTPENKKRLLSIVSLCKERLSKLDDTQKGVRCLENVILICECHAASATHYNS